jgi:ribose-phosphate pyrophosphokinase
MKPLLVPLQDTAQISGLLARALDAEIADVDLRRFPDGETYLRFETSPEGRDVMILAGLAYPDAKLAALVFAAQTARALGATSVGLIAPYLPYMRQDKIFLPGEAVTSVQFAKLVSSNVDWLVTVDPHLHRWNALSDIYDIPTKVSHAASAMADWITLAVDKPLLIGPDSESAQWVAEISALAKADYVILSKTRRGDRDVKITLEDLNQWRGHTPVIVDDTISTATTMIAATQLVLKQGLQPPICCAIHAIFAGDAHHSLREAGAARIVTTNTIAHASNGIDVSTALAAATKVISNANLK